MGPEFLSYFFYFVVFFHLSFPFFLQDFSLLESSFFFHLRRHRLPLEQQYNSSPSILHRILLVNTDHIVN